MKLAEEEMILLQFVMARKSYIWYSMKDDSRFNWKRCNTIEEELVHRNDKKTRGVIFTGSN